MSFRYVAPASIFLIIVFGIIYLRDAAGRRLGAEHAPSIALTGGAGDAPGNHLPRSPGRAV